MAVKEAKRPAGGDYLDLRDIAGEVAKSPDDGALAWFRIVEFEEPERGDYSWNFPVVADVLVVECDHDEEFNRTVWLNTRVLFNAANNLRGHNRVDLKVKPKEHPAPTYDVGDEVLWRVQKIKGKSPNGFVVLNVPSREEKVKAKKVRDELGGDEWGRGDNAPAPSAGFAGSDNSDGSPPF